MEKPKLIAKPAPIVKKEEVHSLHSTHESLYLGGIKSLINKQQKIVDSQTEEETKPRIPHISEKSKYLAQNRTFADLIRPKKKIEEVEEQNKTIVS